MAAGCQGKHLDFTFAMKAILLLSASEQVHYHINKYKLLQIVRRCLFIQTIQLCHGTILMLRTEETSKIQNA